jgi:hypothetical protein
MGFGFDSTPPLLALPADLKPAMEGFAKLHRDHTVGALPRILADRLGVLLGQISGGWRLLWLPAFLIGLFLVPAAGRVALATVGLLYLCYLLYAHESHWSAYYYESTPIIAFVIAVGLTRGLQWGSRRSLTMAPLAVAALGILALGWKEIASARTIRHNEQRPLREFEDLVERETQGPVLVLIRPDPSTDKHLSLVRNSPDPEAAPVLTARDLGSPQNQILARAHPNRTVLVWDQRSNRLATWPGPATPPSP